MFIKLPGRVSASPSNIATTDVLKSHTGSQLMRYSVICLIQKWHPPCCVLHLFKFRLTSVFSPACEADKLPGQEIWGFSHKGLFEYTKENEVNLITRDSRAWPFCGDASLFCGKWVRALMREQHSAQ